MATKEDDFRERFVAVMKELREVGDTDHEAMFLIGSLASTLMKKKNAPSWPAFKSNMLSSEHSMLLWDFEKQGNKFHKEGKRKHAYAVQVLAMSVVAPTQTDPDVATGNKLLDQYIARMVAAFRKAEAMTPKPH
jgi:hypothetical protein